MVMLFCKSAEIDTYEDGLVINVSKEDLNSISTGYIDDFYKLMECFNADDIKMYLETEGYKVTKKK